MKVTNRKLIDTPEVPPRITKLIPIAGELTASSKHSDHQGHDDEDEILEDTKVDITASLEPPSWSNKGKGAISVCVKHFMKDSLTVSQIYSICAYTAEHMFRHRNTLE